MPVDPDELKVGRIKREQQIHEIKKVYGRTGRY